MNMFYAICRWLKVTGDVISGVNVGTIDGYAALNFEVYGFSSFSDVPKNHFVVAAEAATDIDGGIKRKHIRVSLSQVT